MASRFGRLLPTAVAALTLAVGCPDDADEGGEDAAEVQADGETSAGGDAEGPETHTPDGSVDPDVEDDSPGPLFGEWCVGNEDCADEETGGGWCVEGPDSTVCTYPCIDSCPDGWTCKAIQAVGGADLLVLCVPLPAQTCAQCKGASACDGTSDCAVPPGFEDGPAGAGTEGLCLLTCKGEHAQCPEGFVCEDRPQVPSLETVAVCVTADERPCCGRATARLPIAAVWR